MHKTDSRYLVLDQGGHSTRARVFDATLNIVAMAQQPVETAIRDHGHVEQQPQALLASLSAVLAAVAQQLGARVSSLRRAALVVQRSSLLAWRVSSGEALTPVLSWQDTRNAEWLAAHMVGQETWLRQRTGLRTNAHYGASKIRWLLDHDKAVQQALPSGDVCVGPLSSYLLQHLTQGDKPVVDAVIASRTSLTALGMCDWSEDLLSFFGIPRALLPVVQPTLADYGAVQVGEAAVPVRLVGGDQSFFAMAEGEMAPQTVYINVGTGAFLQQCMTPQCVPLGLLASPLLIQPDRQVVVAEGVVNAAATALDWLWQQRGQSLSVAELEQAWTHADAQTVPVFEARMVAGGSPDWLPVGESTFSFDATLPQQAVAVLECVLRALQRNLDCLHTAAACDRIVISGGLSQLRGFCERLSVLAGVPVIRRDDPEASARGAARMLVSEWSNDA